MSTPILAAVTSTLTWWNNYAGEGVTLGRGLAFLLDPNLVDDPEVAYAIM